MKVELGDCPVCIIGNLSQPVVCLGLEVACSSFSRETTEKCLNSSINSSAELYSAEL